MIHPPSRRQAGPVATSGGRSAVTEGFALLGRRQPGGRVRSCCWAMGLTVAVLTSSGLVVACGSTLTPQASSTATALPTTVASSAPTSTVDATTTPEPTVTPTLVESVDPSIQPDGPGGQTSATSVPAEASGPVGTFLADLTAVSGTPIRETVSVNGTSYAHAISRGLVCPAYKGNSATFAYDLGRHQQKFTATVGLTDQSSENGQVRFEVFADGRPLYSQTSTLGVPHQVTVSVAGALRLKLVATNTSVKCNDNYDSTRAVWGDAQVFGSPADVPATGTPSG